MSDTHFTTAGHVNGHDSEQRISAAVRFINRHHKGSKLCIISGDLVNRGARKDYQALKAHFNALSIPYFPLVGNHDDRSSLRSILPLPQNCMPDFIQYAISTSEGLLICLDTQKTNSDAGEFCEARSIWLNETLEAAKDTPVYLFMHHPPMALGLPMQDTENMTDGQAFLDLVGNHPNVKYMFIGHVHRPICGTIRGIPFATMRSALYQAPAPQPEWNWDSFAPSHEAPNLGILTIENSDVNLKYTQFCDYQLGVQTE